LLDLLPPDERFVIVDGGARDVDADPRWRPFPPQRLRFIGFEPDAVEAQRLNSTPGPGGVEWHFVAAGLWGSASTMRFEHNQTSGGSSFLSQNRAVTDRWKFENPVQVALAKNIFFPVRHEAVKVTSLSDWARQERIDSVDFFKLNVQGGELEILRGAGPLINSILGVLVEVSFVESYHNRPMFTDIDRFLRAHGFSFFDLLAHHYVGRAAAPIAAQHLIVAEPKLGQLVSSWGQLVEGHALYFRDPVAIHDPENLPARRILKLAALAEAFGQVEYAFELLDALATDLNATDLAMAAAVRAACSNATAQYNQLRRSNLAT
jgi:FkbM family methyltransferase